MTHSLSSTAKRHETLPHLEETGNPKVVDIVRGLVRFDVGTKSFAWVHYDEIRFVKSADHYVNALVQQGQDLKWMIRHSTLKELLNLLSMDNFIRLNKFYVINNKYFSHIDFHKKLLFLIDGTSIPVTHRISPFIIKPVRE
jgi:DNA-binding LytR/AlgR family response regulator